MKGLKILILDDDDFQRAILKDMITSLGVKEENIKEASDGQEALDIAEEEKEAFDIAFLDLKVPKVDGVEVFRSISESKKSRAFVLLSGLDKSILNTLKISLEKTDANILAVTPKPLALSLMSELIELYISTEESISKESFKIDKIYSIEDIIAGLERDEFIPYFQPQVELKTRKLKGFESLARWIDPQGRIVTPVKFIPLIETDGELNRAFTLKIFEKSLQALKSFKEIDPNIKISINVSSKLIKEYNIGIVVETVSKYLLKPENVIVEITESGFAKNEADFLSALSRLRIAGFGISIDDFGTGFASMSQLRKVPLTEIKIDREFINGITENDKKKAITQMAISLADSLGWDIVTEGAEREEDIEFLKRYERIIVQGYYFSKPLPFDESVEYLRNNIR